MIRADVVFWILIFIWGWIGASRGWVREVIVTFSLLFALFIYSQFGNTIRGFAVRDFVQTKFFARAMPFMLIAFFGYLGPSVARSRFEVNTRGKIEQGLLSFLIGSFNGFLLFSTLMWLAADSGLLTDPLLNPPGNSMFTPPPEGWANFFFVKNSAVAIFSGTTLVVVLVAVFLFVIVVLI